MLAFIHQVFVGLVGDDDQVALDGEGRNFFRLGPREDQAARILRRVVVDGARLRGGKLLERIADAIAARGNCGHEQGPRLGRR